MDSSLILLDDPAPMVCRITLNRPEKRNAVNATLRREILAATCEADRDDSGACDCRPWRGQVLLGGLRPLR